MVDVSLVSSVAAASAAVLALALVTTIRWAVRSSDKLASVPLAPNAVPILGHTLEFFKHQLQIHDWFASLCAKFEDKPFRLQIFGQETMTVLNTPALFEDVLKTQFEVFDKGAFFCENLATLLGSGIFAVDGVKWMHQRKTASNLFTMRTLRDTMAHTVQDLMPTVLDIFNHAASSQEPLDMFKFLNRFTIDGFAKIGFGVDLHSLETKEDHPFVAAFDGAQRALNLRFVRPRIIWKVLRLLNMGVEAELTKHLKVIDDTVLSIIAQSLERRQRADASASSGKDIVSLFLDDVSHNDKRSEEPFDPVFLRDIVVNFLIAGRDTTAQALSWFFYELSENPRVATKIRDELRVCLPFLFDAKSVPTMEQVQQLTYLEAALKETLRLHPSVPVNSKLANRDTVLSDGTFIPKGSSVQISSYCLGRAKHVWGPDASAFRPERWIDPLNPSKLITVSAFQFISFHAGPRMCLGMNLAMMEMKILVATLLSKFRVELVPGQNVTYDLSLTLPVKGAMSARIHAL